MPKNPHIFVVNILNVRVCKKIYISRFGGNKVETLKSISFGVEQCEYVAIWVSHIQVKRLYSMQYAKKWSRTILPDPILCHAIDC